MDGAQHAGMRRAVVDEDSGVRDGESAGQDLDQQDASYGEPDEDAGGLGRGGGGGRDDGEVRGEGVGDREEAEAVAETAGGAQCCVDFGKYQELQGDADDTSHGHCEANATGWHAQAACK